MAMSGAVTTPEEFFGFQMGSDMKIARWDRIVEYFRLLEKQSNKIKVVDMGPSTEGNPFLLVIISSEENLRNLERLREVNLRLSDPRGLWEEEVEALIGEGKAVICQSMSLHATEIGGSQMAPELAFDLLTRNSEETRRILEDVVFLVVPCFNPDGQIMVTDWYERWLGTEHEGCGLPWLYHKYVGHDNNRDAFQTNMVESRYMASILFRDWVPQAYIDHHHMGSYGARLYVPPYCEPIHPHADPLIWREHSWYGAHMAYRLEEAGKTGILNAAQYLAWGHLGFHWITEYHNIAGMLTESASAKLATPLYIHRSQLRGDRRGTLASYDPQTNFPHPWPGGWWRLRDIVEQQKISAWAALDLAARHKETVLRNAYMKAKRQTERGDRGKPKAYVIPLNQHDPLTAVKLIGKLLVQGIEVHRAKEEFAADGISYPAGSHIVFLAQPKCGLVRTLLGRTIYPDNAWTRGRDDSPLRPQDTATDTMAEFMGVRVDPVDGIVEGDFEKIVGVEASEGRAPEESTHGYVLDCRLNDSYTAVNRLLTKGVSVWRASGSVEVGVSILPPGSFVIQKVEPELLQRIAGDLGLTFHPLSEKVAEKRAVQRLRVGMYQRYWGGNIDEGWTRWLLEQFEFPYTTLTDADIKEGSLMERLDVIILPDDPTSLITGEGVEEWWKEHRPDWPLPVYPPEYRSGIGSGGVEALKGFVEKGGTLIAFNRSCEFAIDKLGLDLRNVLANVPSSEFFCPGSTLRTLVDVSHPLAYGMPEEGFIFFWDSPAFEILPSGYNDRYKVVVDYPDRDILQSGWLIGEERLGRRAAMVAAHHGEGKVILFGFRVQHRAQTHGTFKLLFNSLLG